MRHVAVPVDATATARWALRMSDTRFDGQRIMTLSTELITCRLILMGSYLEHVTGNDPDKRDRLIKGLDVFLERDRDRELFDLAPN